MTRGELETGIFRLASAGHVICSSDGYAPSEAVREFYKKSAGPRESLCKLWDKLAIFIDAPGRNAQSEQLPETDEEQYVPKSAYEAAIKGYI